MSKDGAGVDGLKVLSLVRSMERFNCLTVLVLNINSLRHAAGTLTHCHCVRGTNKCLTLKHNVSCKKFMVEIWPFLFNLIAIDMAPQRPSNGVINKV